MDSPKCPNCGAFLLDRVLKDSLRKAFIEVGSPVPTAIETFFENVPLVSAREEEQNGQP